MNTPIRDIIAKGPMTTFQIVVIGVCICLNMLDGFDILAMSFAASGVKANWALADSQLGVLLSAGLVGMGLGSLTLGPCADRWGRRTIVLLAITLAGLGMVGSAVARSFAELLTLRAATGFGIGGTIACVSVIVSEYSSDRWRGVALGAYATGYSVGATIGGFLTALAIPMYGWRSAFAIGGAMTLLLLPLAWFRLPESAEFLITRRPPSAQRRLNVLLAAIHAPPIDSMPEATRDASRPGVPFKLLMTRATALAWPMFFCTMAGFYFIVSWTPRLLNAAGLTARQGLTGGVLLNLGGIAGCGLYALAAARADTRRLLFFSLVASAVLISLFGSTLGELNVALWTALFVGIITNAAMAGLYAVGPPLYPTEVRATGMGWAIGIGRFGAILAPFASGALLDHGWTPAQLYKLFAVPYLVAAVAILLIGSSGPRRAQQVAPQGDSA